MKEETLITLGVGLATTLIASIFSFLSGRGAATATIQGMMNQTFAELVKELKTEVAALRSERDANEKKCEQEINALRQQIYSLESLLRNAGLPIPSRPAPSAVVFEPKPEVPRG